MNLCKVTSDLAALFSLQCQSISPVILNKLLMTAKPKFLEFFLKIVQFSFSQIFTFHPSNNSNIPLIHSINHKTRLLTLVPTASWPSTSTKANITHNTWIIRLSRYQKHQLERLLWAQELTSIEERCRMLLHSTAIVAVVKLTTVKSTIRKISIIVLTVLTLPVPSNRHSFIQCHIVVITLTRPMLIPSQTECDFMKMLVISSIFVSRRRHFTIKRRSRPRTLRQTRVRKISKARLPSPIRWDVKCFSTPNQARCRQKCRWLMEAKVTPWTMSQTFITTILRNWREVLVVRLHIQLHKIVSVTTARISVRYHRKTAFALVPTTFSRTTTLSVRPVVLQSQIFSERLCCELWSWKMAKSREWPIEWAVNFVNRNFFAEMFRITVISGAIVHWH